MKSFHAVLSGGVLLVAAFAARAALAQSEACKLPQPDAGRVLFAENCTACHGDQGKGGGLLAEALKLSPPDLTRLSARANGAFPSAHVLSILRDGGGETAGGDKTMPMWSKIFAHECGEAYGQQAIAEIRRYIETLQVR